MKNWDSILQSEFSKDYFKSISSFLKAEYLNNRIFPPKNLIFKAFNEYPIENIKAVILGMDPYPTKGNAHGLAFSVNYGVKTPASLRNIYKELSTDLDIATPNHGNLESWAKQGVMLLNTALTVREGTPGSHMKIWEPFTKQIIKELNSLEQPIVFILWGNFARSKKYLITNENHCILESAHPSPLSAHAGFLGSKPFSKTNNFLIANNIKPIDWSIQSV